MKPSKQKDESNLWPAAVIAVAITVILFLAVGMVAAAQAEEDDDENETGWRYEAAAGVEMEPDYAGSDDYEIGPALFARAIYRDASGHRYALGLNALGAWWDLGGEWTLGTVLEYEEGRDNQNSALKGLDGQRDTLEGEFTLARELGPWELGFTLQPDLLGRGKGLVAFLGAEWEHSLAENLRVGAAADVSWGNSEYMKTEFGISPRESAASGLSAYAPGSGFKSATLELSAEYFINEKWSVVAAGGIEYYHAAAARSPLVADEGSRLAREFALGLRRSW